MKKIAIFSIFIFSAVFLVGSFFVGNIFAGSKTNSDYAGSIKKCLDAKKISQEKGITDFYCPEGLLSTEDVAYQVVLDLKFREVDEKVEKWFQEFSSSKGKGYTPAQMSVEIDKAFGGGLTGSGFAQEYLSVCNNLVIGEVMKHFSNLTTNNNIDSVIKNGAPCQNLAAQKIAAYRSGAWVIATQNISENYRSDKKQFTDQLKEKYRNLLMKFAVYTDKLSRIEKKWDKKIKTVQQ